MQQREVRLITGSLLHDIGKVVYRYTLARENHSVAGYKYLKEKAGITDPDILHCVRYHHGAELSSAGLDENDLAYITYIADNIASAADRREKNDGEEGFDVQTPLQPVFNLLNGNSGDYYYLPEFLGLESEINYPTKEKKIFSKEQYGLVLNHISENLKGIDYTPDYLNSLLDVLEANLSYIPSSTSKREIADISLYDHSRLTAAFASCIYQYLEGDNRSYRDRLFDHAKDFYREDAFLLASLDVSGIQKFIYTIQTKNALRTLRARSFYLEIMMEHMIDILLEREELSRANLIYSGGGHCYVLLPDTRRSREIFDQFVDEINEWFLEKFQTDLYIAGGYAACSCLTLKNEPSGSYSDIFRNISQKLAEKKAARYSAAQIIRLNSTVQPDYTRECATCKRIGKINAQGVCPICSAMEKLSGMVLYADYFSIIKGENEKPEGHARGLSGADKELLPLPGGYYLTADTKESLEKRIAQDSSFVRAYGKNRMYTGKNISTKLWVGNYTNGATFEQFAQEAEGIERIGILRADVDNLGHAFVAGFDNPENNNRYVTLSRTAALSRQLSLFFKLYINRILAQPSFSVESGYSVGHRPSDLPDEKKKPEGRKVTIVYSGGDDLFIVGAWNEIIEAAVDIKQCFARYTEGTLTLSAGIGIYRSGFPVSVSAQEVAALENKSKELPGKNAITIFEDGRYHSVRNQGKEFSISDGTYSWPEFENQVIQGKYAVISTFFDHSQERGKAFMYHLLELIRNQSDRINFARYVYLLSRMEPAPEADKEEKQLYQDFSRDMYQWVQNEKDCRELRTAMNLYAYLRREREEDAT